MKKCLASALLFVSIPSMAQQIYLRTPGTGYCTVTNASNTTPVAITVASIADCGLSNGDKIAVDDIEGNIAANTHVRSAGSSTHLVRIVSGLSGNTFNILDLSSANVVGSGNYTSGGRVGKVTAYTARPTYGVLLDGPTGQVLADLLNTSGRKNASNPAYVQIQNISNSYVAKANEWGREYGFTENGAGVLTTAMRCYVDSHSPSCTAALESLREPSQLVGTFACDPKISGYCGAGASGTEDYDVQYAAMWAMAYSMMRSSMTPTERQTFLNYHLNASSWSIGGTDYDSVNHVKPTWDIGWVNGSSTTVDGTVTVVSGSDTVMGIGTNFTVTVSTGDIIVIPHRSLDSYAKMYKVKTVVSNTELKIYSTIDGNNTNVNYQVGPGWDSTQMGLSWYAGQFPYDWNTPGVSIKYPFGGYSANDPLQNLTMVRMLGHIARGFAFCDEDVRGCLVAQRNYNAFYDLTMRQHSVVQARGGFNASNTQYNCWRVISALLETITMVKNGIENGPNLCNYFGTFCEDGIDYVTHLSDVGSLTFLPHAENNQFSFDEKNITREAYHSMFLLGPTHDKSKQFNNLMTNIMAARVPYTTGQVGNYAWWQYLLRDPSTGTSTPPTTFLGTTTRDAECSAIWGASRCTTEKAMYMSISRTGWTNKDALLQIDSQSGACVDHCGKGTPGVITLWNGGQKLLSADNLQNFGNDTTQRNVVLLNNSASIPAVFFPTTRPVYPRWASGNELYAFVRSDLTPLYLSSTNPQAVERQVIHIKSGDSYVIDHVRADQTAAGKPWVQYMLRVEGCGTVTSSSCAFVNRGSGTFTNKKGGRSLLGKVFGVSGNAVIKTENNSDTDLSYIGGSGYSGRFDICISTDGTNCRTDSTSSEWFTVMRSTDDTKSLATVSTQTVGGFRIAEIKDSVSPAVAAFTVLGSSYTSLSFTTTHVSTAPYLITGLKTGTYSVKRNSVDISTGTNVLAGEQALMFIAPSGNIEINQLGVTLNITTLSLSSGTVGNFYSQTIAAEGGTPAYTWSLDSGSLCDGLSFSSGTISGTPTTAETCNFVIRVTDSVSATDTQSLSITVGAGAGGGVATQNSRYYRVRSSGLRIR